MTDRKGGHSKQGLAHGEIYISETGRKGGHSKQGLAREDIY